jgi:hypothetical protein
VYRHTQLSTAWAGGTTWAVGAADAGAQGLGRDELFLSQWDPNRLFSQNFDVSMATS